MNKGIKVLLPVVLFACAGLNAATPGAYIGAGAGYSELQSEEGAEKVDDGGLGGRAFLGYNFNHYFGVETNYSTIYKTRYTLDEYPNVTVDYKLNALSLVVKGYLPISNSGAFNLYGLAGLAQVYGDVDARMDYMSILKDSDNGIVPTFGFGASYDINQRITAHLEVSGFGSKEPDTNHFGVPQSSLTTFGLAYKF